MATTYDDINLKHQSILFKYNFNSDVSHKGFDLLLDIPKFLNMSRIGSLQKTIMSLSEISASMFFTNHLE